MNFKTARNNMLTQQLRPNNVLNEEVLNLIAEVPREHFVPAKFKELAYSDTTIPLEHNQAMMTPLEEALILQAVMPLRDKVLLEVGTGSGYLTALLAKTAKQVHSVEYYADLSATAGEKLAAHNITNVNLIVGDGLRGYMELAPFDIIILGGAIPRLQKCYQPQLSKRGKMVAIIGQEPIMEACLFTLDNADHWQRKLLFETKIEPLINRMAKPTFVF